MRSSMQNRQRPGRVDRAQKNLSHALATARRIIPDSDDRMLSAILHGLEQMKTRPPTVIEIVQTVSSYQEIARALQATPEGQQIYGQYVGGSIIKLMCVIRIIEE